MIIDCLRLIQKKNYGRSKCMTIALAFFFRDNICLLVSLDDDHCKKRKQLRIRYFEVTRFSIERKIDHLSLSNVATLVKNGSLFSFVLPLSRAQRRDDGNNVKKDKTSRRNVIHMSNTYIYTSKSSLKHILLFTRRVNHWMNLKISGKGKFASMSNV